MVKDVNGRFDDYSISPKIRQILFHEDYCQFNRKEILQKAKYRHSKEKVAGYYLRNKEAIKEKSKNRYKILSKEEKTRLKSIKEKDPV